jgi:hypothetical protein
MKHHLREPILLRREYDIIEFIKQNPYCTLDSIFTKCHIPKSKVTVELIKKLVSQKKISVSPTTKSRYYIGEIDLLKEFEISTRDIEHDLKKNPSQNNHLMKVYMKFRKLRIRVLKAEKRQNPEIDFRDTLKIFALVINYHKKPSKLMEILLLDQLSLAIQDDKYYLEHQLHSAPRENEYVFQEAKKRHLRRSATDLLEMKEKGRDAFSLSKSNFDKNMERLTNDPHAWLDRIYAERDRTLYQNPPDLVDKVRKKALSKKFKPVTDEDKKMKPVIDEYRKTFPKFPIKAFFEALSDEHLEEMRQIYEEGGLDFDDFMKSVRSRKYISPDTFRTSQTSS